MKQDLIHDVRNRGPEEAKPGIIDKEFVAEFKRLVEESYEL